jgi:hypothetical protein
MNFNIHMCESKVAFMTKFKILIDSIRIKMLTRIVAIAMMEWSVFFELQVHLRNEHIEIGFGGSSSSSEGKPKMKPPSNQRKANGI